MQIYNSPINITLHKDTKTIPNQGRKTGTNAIDDKIAETIKFMFVYANSYSKNIDATKCQNTINRVALIKAVTDVSSSY